MVAIQTLDDFVHGGNIIIFHAAAEGVGQQFFGQAAVEFQFMVGDEDVLELGDVGEGLAGGELPGRIDLLLVFLGRATARGR